MTQIFNVQSTAPSVITPDINVDTVYVRVNIQDIHNEENPVLWQYDETQYGINEYLIHRITELEEKIANL